MTVAAAPAAPSTPAVAAPPAPAAPVAPTRGIQLANFVVFQGAWFAAVLGAAHGLPAWGTAAVVAAIGWHLAVSARPVQEARLVMLACAVGLAVETAAVWQGNVAYPSGQPIAWLAPYWMVALWGLLAIALNVTMRWLKNRLWLAGAFGAVGGPMSFAGGVKLGGASFIHETAALATMACVWLVLMPALVWASNRFDGVAVPVPAGAADV
jgi:hypothetical protein